MTNKPVQNRSAFTLIELLAVIAIITLLMGILVPAVSNARDQAKKAKSQTQFKAISTGIEQFATEQGARPESNGLNPFEPSNTGAYLTGAQWLALQLVGADLRGWVKPDDANDSDANGKIDDKDWLDWYGLGPKKNYQRFGPYVTPDSNSVMSPETWAQKNPSAGPMPANMQRGNSIFKNSKVPFFVDAFGQPILYYAASDFEQTRMVWNGNTNKNTGHYDPSDNSMFTGMDGKYGRNPRQEEGWDLSGNGRPHAMKRLGFVNETTLPEPETFSRVVCDMGLFNQTRQGDKGRVWPYRAGQFLLISPGKDGLYGNKDDVRNFEAAN